MQSISIRIISSYALLALLCFFSGIIQCTSREIFSSTQIVLEPDMGMILIPEGSYIMGSNSSSVEYDERFAHEVYLSAYYIAQNTVTNREFLEYWEAEDGGNLRQHTPPQVGSLPWPLRAQRQPEYPIVGVNWIGANRYIEWKIRRTGKKYRLPTEAEWEKAARGTDDRMYPWGNESPDADNKYRANFLQAPIPLDGYKLTSPVTFFNGINLNTGDGKSPYSLYDMAGNVWEWVADWYSQDYYRESPKVNPKGPLSNPSSLKCLRGGSYEDPAFSIRSTNRKYEYYKTRKIYIGFRLVMDPE